MKKLLSLSIIAILIMLMPVWQCQAQIPTDSLSLYYPFNGNADDESEFGQHDGTVFGATLVEDRFGNPNSAYFFAGDDFIVGENAQSINFGTANFTISLWVNCLSFSESDVFVKSPIDSWTTGSSGVKLTNNSVYFGTCGYNTGPIVTPSLSVMLWYHVVVIHDNDNNNLTYWIDAVKYEQSYVANLPPDGNNDEVILVGRNGEGWFLNGSIDDIRVYQRILDSTEVLELFNENISTTLQPEICIVSIDSAFNNIIWEKQITTEIDSFRIYRESTQANVFEHIGSVDYDEQSIFIDENSMPTQRAYKYKISAVKNDGVETPLSEHHKTMHLMYNMSSQGLNLSWNHYEGFYFYTYYIYKGIATNDFVLFDSISSNFTSYTDISQTWDNVHYYIEVRNLNCSGSRGIRVSKSNILSPVVTSISNNFTEKLLIYPNPVINNLNIEKEGKNTICIFDVNGRQILTEEFFNKTTVDLSFLDSGFYFYRIGDKTGKIIKN